MPATAKLPALPFLCPQSMSADPSRMAPAYDSGDHLHPSDAGYERVAAVVRLDRL